MYLTKSKNRLYISGASFNIGLRVLKIIKTNAKDLFNEGTGEANKSRDQSNLCKGSFAEYGHMVQKQLAGQQTTLRGKKTQEIKSTFLLFKVPLFFCLFCTMWQYSAKAPSVITLTITVFQFYLHFFHFFVNLRDDTQSRHSEIHQSAFQLSHPRVQLL